ncbi:MAG: DUF2304 domain-containing protein [Acidobacteriota bacterium]
MSFFNDLNMFQAVGLTFLTLAAAATLTASLRHRISRRAGLGWLSLWVGSAIALRWPETTKVAASFLGISRGADLVFYSAILAALAAFFLLFLRLRQAENHITELTRRIAILHAQKSLPKSRSTAADRERSDSSGIG